MSMPENSSPPIDAGANMTRVEAWNAGTREGFRGYRGLPVYGVMWIFLILQVLMILGMVTPPYHPAIPTLSLMTPA